MGVTLTMLNQKGGVGKTSSCHHLAGAFSARGRRVLLVDNDPQASLTQGFLGPAAVEGLEAAETVAGLYSRQAWASGLAISTGLDGVDLIPGGEAATEFNVPLPFNADWSLQRALADGLAPIRDDYDLILIDCPPNLHLCSWSALAASDCLIVPLKPEDYGAQGISAVSKSIAAVQAGINPELVLLGYLLTLVAPRKSIHKLYEETLRGVYGPLVLDARMAEAVDYVEALNARKTVQQFKPKGAAAKAMRAIADEIEARLDRVKIGAQDREAA
jgi:chromosome partitioning protein